MVQFLGRRTRWEFQKYILCGISGKVQLGPDSQNIRKLHWARKKQFHLSIVEDTVRLIDKLKKEKMQIVALEQDKKAISYEKFNPKFPLALIVGNEVKGVSKKVLKKADKIIFLPMRGKKESLNVSVAFGVAGYQIIKFARQ